MGRGPAQGKGLAWTLSSPKHFLRLCLLIFLMQPVTEVSPPAGADGAPPSGALYSEPVHQGDFKGTLLLCPSQPCQDRGVEGAAPWSQRFCL